MQTMTKSLALMAMCSGLLLGGCASTEDVDRAQGAADAAQSSANTALSSAQAAQRTADEASQKADRAISLAQETNDKLDRLQAEKNAKHASNGHHKRHHHYRRQASNVPANCPVPPTR